MHDRTLRSPSSPYSAAVQLADGNGPAAMQQFASDNCAGICPEVWTAMELANQGHAQSYGDDLWTGRASEALRDLFEADCEVFFTFNGTAANSLALASLCQSYHSVVCASTAHVETDECGAPEFFSNGSKLLVAASPSGKLDPESVRTLTTSRKDIHFPKTRAVTITQSTETGLVYSPGEIAAMSEECKRLGLRLHMDGARFVNACASLACSPADMTWRAGVDVLCFGGTKNGMAVGEAVIFFDKALAEDFGYRCKQSGQLASKMRFLAAPWISLLETGAWLKNAQHANACAKRLEAAIAGTPGISIAFPVQANAVFIHMSAEQLIEIARRGWTFYTFIGGCARFMFAWDSDPARVDALASDLRHVAGSDGVKA